MPKHRKGPCGTFSPECSDSRPFGAASHFRSGCLPGPADTSEVARQHYIIMIFGVLGMVLLSTLMKHFLQASTEQTSPIAVELHADLASEFEREPAYRLKMPADGKALGVAEVKIFPRLGVSAKPLAKRVGDWIWRRLGGKADEVHVICVDWSSGAEKLFPVDRPYLSAPPGAGTQTRNAKPSKAEPGSGAPGPTKRPAGQPAKSPALPGK